MTLLIILLVFSVALNVALIAGAIFSRADQDMEIINLREKLKAQQY
jgi:hypothetical protein